MAQRNGLAALPRPEPVLKSYQPTFRERMADALRQTFYSDDRAGQRQAEKVMNVFEAVTPVGVATGVDDAREAFGQGDYAGAGMLLGMAGLPGPNPKGIRAFHGSPHSFDRFSMDKIGTGEGAQAYGHGLYFAENEGVAKGYREALAAKADPKLKVSGNEYVAKGGGIEPGSKEDVIHRLWKNRMMFAADNPGVAWDADLTDEVLDNVLDNIKASNEVRKWANAEIRGNPLDLPPSGSMYEVNIKADPESFLDWDKPLSEQPKVLDMLGYTNAKYPEDIIPDTSWTGSKLWAETQGGPDDRRKYLLSGIGTKKTKDGTYEKPAGIPGIKYLDAGSRGNVNVNDIRGTVSMLEVAARKHPNDTFIASQLADAKKQLEIAERGGTRNYVVFDDKLIEIVRKYGIAGASAMLGYNILDGMDEAQASQLQQLEQNR